MKQLLSSNHLQNAVFRNTHQNSADTEEKNDFSPQLMTKACMNRANWRTEEEYYLGM